MLGILLILLALLLGYATRSVFNERGFAQRIADSFEDPRFATFVAEKIADKLIDARPDLVGVRPVLIGLGRSLVSSPPFRAAVRRSARAMHHAMLSGSGDEIVLTVQDLGALLRSTLETQPALAKRVPPAVYTALGSLGALRGGELAMRIVRIGNRMRVAAFALLLLGIVLCAVGAALSGDRRRAIVRLGAGLAALALVLGITARFGGDIVALFARDDLAPPLAGFAGAFLRGLMPWAAGLGFAGLVLSAASASLLERVALARWSAGVRRWMFGHQPLMRMRLARGLLGALAGAALLFWPLQSLTLAGWFAGLVVTFSGLREGFAAALHLLPEIEKRARPADRPRVRRRAIALVTGIAILLIGGAMWMMYRSTEVTVAPATLTACNGSAALCDRTLDQVIFPTSHNSMGGADDPGWMFPNQDAGIRRQLEDGVRGFLIDVHYGVPVGDKVKTELEDEKAAMAKYEAALGPEGMAAVIRIRDRLAGQKHGARGVYMCHGFCELGALAFVPMLREVRDFLTANPGEVVIFVIQDEGVTPQDVELCFRESGLLDFVYRGPARPPWPTLREMVESDQRVLVMGENVTAGVDWYHPAFEVLQETPYSFRDTLDFSNRPNRGGKGGSLLLMNHWIESTPMPKPSNAAVANSRRKLLERIRAFRRERGRVPNLVAVDFYGVGDLIPVVRELNEKGSIPAPLPAKRR